MKNKTLIANILGAVLTFALAYKGVVSPQTAMALGIVIAIINPILKSPIFESSPMLPSWTLALWISNIASIILQIVNGVAGYGIISPELLNMITIGINTTIILAGQTKF